MQKKENNIKTIFIQKFIIYSQNGKKPLQFNLGIITKIRYFKKIGML